ncbi:uncharacterized protein LOC119077324 isoform X2 [Bradysia coprophila]|uniref:uncharacterized protein LOC119077324 isoform X2 n=1 Tax=Bradysia coprophila TaxID=38358 RepID=UPI00187D810A|nr:uncharacterized protein LOC119077324 isoform X2 [Bradysia coprophila]
MRSVLSVIVIIATISGGVHSDETDYNIISPDGSFSFGLSNNDYGAHYHTASGANNKIVRGRYGSRNPETGRVDETTYTAGPRGFRARGPNIHRKMDLSQVPRGPIGSIDDPLADPYDDPSYGFGFRTSEYQRREDGDSTGRVRGLYSYIDDIGERHSVRYAAGAGTGYEVTNAVPDSPSFVRYTAPLYKANRLTRGRISYERGPGAQYKFISSGPDQRRSESTGADGITRGSYSYLDDKGVQRTVEYIAGAGIGYRVVKTTTGPGSHLVPRPYIPDFNSVPPQSNDISDIDGSGFKTAESGSVVPNRGSGGQNNVYDNAAAHGNRERDPAAAHGNRERDPLHSSQDHPTSGSSFSSGTNSGGNAHNSPSSPNYHKTDGHHDNSVHDTDSSHRQTSSSNRGSTRYSGNKGSDYSPNNRPNVIASLGPPYITRDHFGLNAERNSDWSQHHQDSTLIKNTGDWYVGLPPGSAVRAHVQSIDLLPLGGRPPSPSDALRRDEQRSKQY